MSIAESFTADYITDEHGKKKAVVLSSEDLHDLGVVAERRDEETLSHDELLKELGRGSSL